MRFNTSAFLVLVAFAALHANSALAEKAKEDVTEAENYVEILTKSNFSDAVKESDKVSLIKFYAPWCGHCKAMKPHFEAAALELKDSKVRFAEVDCTAESELCQEHGVQGYPTLKVFRESGVGEYRGGRQTSDFVTYMKKQLLPDITLVTADDIEKFKDSDKVVVIAHFASEDDDDYKNFKKVAAELRDSIVFGATFDKKVAKKVGIKKAPSVTVFQQFDDGRVDFEEKEFSKDALESFVTSNSIPLLNELGPENFMTYIESGKPLAYLFVTDDKQREDLGNKLRPVAKEFKGKVSFVFIDANQFGEHASTLNLKQEWPAFAIQEPTSQFKFPFSQEKEIDGESIQEFVQSYVDGKIQPSIKSEPIPETNDEDVKVVVADNFDDLVLDKKKDVLIMFHAPWCGHCKKLKPTYEALAAKYSTHGDKLVIAKMDATANDVPPSANFTVEGFPTIKLIKAETNEVVEYEGDRSEDSFIEFLDKHSHHKVEPVKKADKKDGEDEEEEEETTASDETAAKKTKEETKEKKTKETESKKKEEEEEKAAESEDEPERDEL
ncbi:thioredoxin-like domain-containing protein [Syncephalis plumigaleata]|nr:thioredoxin-like domain-containing protein [Syncephalis plumigaleata]